MLIVQLMSGCGPDFHGDTFKTDVAIKAPTPPARFSYPETTGESCGLRILLSNTPRTRCRPRSVLTLDGERIRANRNEQLSGFWRNNWLCRLQVASLVKFFKVLDLEVHCKEMVNDEIGVL